MALITENCLEDIRQKVDLVDLASSYVTLKRSGTIYKGLSPFNTEKTPSFVVYPDSQIFKCFSSGHAGNLFRFVQLIENLTFPESIEWLADRYKIHLEYEQSASGRPLKSPSIKKRLLDIHEVAASHYHQCFFSKADVSVEIRKYWVENRSFSLDHAKDYKIGFSDPKSLALKELLFAKGYSNKELVESGLYYGRSNDTIFPRFTGRLMIPIRDIQGRVIAFTARKTGFTPESPSSDAKYINSPETPIFYKSKVLFGLDHAKNHVNEMGSFILVEGQLDAIRCWTVGVHNAIAPQGTSVTVEQLQLLKRYSPKYVECLLDGDSAGTKAAIRLIPLGFKAGIDLTFTSLENGQDPDTLFAGSGKNGLVDLKFRNVNPIDFLIMTKKGEDSLGPGELENLSIEFFSYIDLVESEIKKSEYIRIFSTQLGLDLSSVQMDFDRFVNNRFKKISSRNTISVSNKEDNLDKKLSKELTTIEYVILFLLLHHEELQEHMSQVINPEWINISSIYGSILHRVLLEMQEGLWEGIRGISELLEGDEETDALYTMLSQESNYEEPFLKANQCLKDLFNRFLRRQENLLRKKSEDPSLSQEESNFVQKERIHLRQLKKTPPQIEFQT